MAGGKIALCLVLGLLVITALVFLVLIALYYKKYTNCINNPLSSCNPLKDYRCSDGSIPGPTTN